MDCKECKILEKGWCTPLKQWQCKNDIDNEEFIHLLILKSRDQNRRLLEIYNTVVPSMNALNRMNEYRKENR